MRIDLLLDSRAYGGIESHVFQLAKALHACGHDTTVIFMKDYGAHPLKDKLNHEGIPFEHLSSTGLGSINALKLRSPDVLHTHGYKAGILGRLAALNSDIGCCSSYHAGEKPTGRLIVYTWLDRITANLADKIIAVSDAIAQELPNETHVLNNFVESSIGSNRGDRIAYVGRLSHEKGADRLIECAKILPKTEFDIYGEGPLMEEYLASAPKNVLFHGRCNMEEIWQDIGLLVMPSRAEGLPLAALEAMSHGAAVIATKVGALPQLIDHRKNGWLIDGSINEICKYVLEWKEQPELARAQMSYTSQVRIANRYSDKVMLPKFLDCYLDAAVGQ